MSRNSTHFILGRQPWITSNGQGIERPGLLRVPGGHTISRRSAAEGCADAPLLPSNTARRTVSTLTNASDQLSGSCRAIVRAECTAAVPLAQKSGSSSQAADEHEAAAVGVGRGSAFRVRDSAASPTARSGVRNVDFLGKWVFRPQNFLRLRRASGGFA